jgi:hypothetical protein
MCLAAYRERGRYSQPVILGDVPLRPEEMLVEFKMLKHSVVVWMVGGSAAGAHLVAFYKVDRPRQWFEKRIFSLRNAFNTGHPERFEAQTCEELFTSVFPEPFAQLLEAAGRSSSSPTISFSLSPLRCCRLVLPRANSSC